MTIQLENGWAQWDWQIGTFRALVNGEIYGKFTGDINTAAELAVRLPIALTAEQIKDLEEEKTSYEEQNKEVL